MSEELIMPVEVERKAGSIDFSSYTKRIAPLLDGLSKWSRGIPLVLAFFVVWEALPRFGVIDTLFLPAFSTTIHTLFDLTVSGKLLPHVVTSLQRSVIGFSLALFLAVPLGFLMGWYNKVERYTDLFVQSLRNTSTFALMPIFLLLLGLGESSKIAIIFYGASWQLLMNTISGVKSVDPIYIKAAKSMGVSDWDLFRKVILPASIPSIVIGARLGAKISLMVVIAAEMIGAKSGLGFFIQNAQFNFMVFEKKTTYWKGEIGSSILG
jgi:NitT/TauT family transport system permease protein